MQINNSPMFSGLFSKKDDKAQKAHHGHGAKHAHHAGHHKKHQPAFGAVTASADSFQRHK